jgi:hypothetical protein
MEARLTEKPIAKLTRREKALIRWGERHKMGDWPKVSARVETGKGSAEDVAKMEKLAEDTKKALEKALQDKIAITAPPKPKRKYEKVDPNLSKQDRDRIRQEKDRIRQAKHRAKTEKPKKPKRTPEEQKEYDRLRKAEYRARNK